MTIMRLYNRNGLENETVNHNYRFSDMLKDVFGNNYNENFTSNKPGENIKEENDSFLIMLAVPGLKKSDIQLNLEKDILHISHKQENSDVNENFSRMEFDFRNFERSFRIPETIHTEKIKAGYENGILTVTLPKREEAIDRGPREINIS